MLVELPHQVLKDEGRGRAAELCRLLPGATACCTTSLRCRNGRLVGVGRVRQQLGRRRREFTALKHRNLLILLRKLSQFIRLYVLVEDLTLVHVGGGDVV